MRNANTERRLCLLIMVLVLYTAFLAYLERGCDTQQNPCKLLQPPVLSSDLKDFLAYVYEIKLKFPVCFLFFSLCFNDQIYWMKRGPAIKR